MILNLPDACAKLETVQIVQNLAKIIFPVLDVLELEKLDTHNLEEDLEQPKLRAAVVEEFPEIFEALACAIRYGLLLLLVGACVRAFVVVIGAVVAAIEGASAGGVAASTAIAVFP
ncbi:hypothetical protein HG531_000698 [Fusarium graminearum]|nr:hypothetical protein HG531_000698 [Fusarium graminearum]